MLPEHQHQRQRPRQRLVAFGLQARRQLMLAGCWALLLQLRQAGATVGPNYNSSAYKDPHYAPGRTTMVHLFEWKFPDIARECEDFLGPAGYGGVQVSPINENVVMEGRPWYERYQPMSFKMETRSGSERDFADMVSRCNAVGVRIYVDAVVNHMTGNVQPAVGTAGSRADPERLSYPGVPFGPADFHQPCSIDNYQDAVQVRNCDLSGLHDLDQGKARVRDKIVRFLNRAIDHGVAGFRFDAAKHMWPADLERIYGRMRDLKGAAFLEPGAAPSRKRLRGRGVRPFVFQEVIDLGGEAVSKWEYNELGTVVEFVFGAVLGNVFRGREPLADLQHWGFADRNLLPTGDSLVMVDNHDNQRGHGAGGEAILTHQEPRLYKMAVAFMLAHPYGHPRVMSSFAFSDPSQGPPADAQGGILSPQPVCGANVSSGEEPGPCGRGWVCEHRWPQVYRMVEFRNVVQDAPLTNWWSNGRNQIAFSRGSLGFVAFNGEYGVDLKERLQTGLPVGQYCDVVSGRARPEGGGCTGKTVVVGDDGAAYVEILKDEQEGVLAIHARSKL